LRATKISPLLPYQAGIWWPHHSWRLMHQSWIVHPLVVGVDPVLGHELDFAAAHRLDGLFGNRLALGARLGHGHEPLVGQHGLDHLAGAGAARHHQLVLLDLDQQAVCVQLGDQVLAGLEPVQVAVGLGDLGQVRHHLRVQGEDGDHGQAVAQANLVVVGVVRGRDLDDAGAEILVHVFVGDDRHQAAGDGQLDQLADQVGVALVFGVHHHGGVAQHGLRPGGGHDQGFVRTFDGVTDVPHEAVFFLALDFEVGHGGLEDRVPADQALAAVDQAFFMQANEGLDHHLGQLIVHGEVLVLPADRVAHAAHLLGDGGAALLFPFPHAGHEVLAAQVVAGLFALHAFFLQLALHHDLCGDAGVVGAGDPQGVVALHAVVARQRVHDGLVEGVAHVQGAGHIGWRQLDAKRGLGRVQRGFVQAALLPLRAVQGLDGARFEGFGEFGHGSGCRSGCHWAKRDFRFPASPWPGLIQIKNLTKGSPGPWHGRVGDLALPRARTRIKVSRLVDDARRKRHV